MQRSQAIPGVGYSLSVKDPLIRLACIWPATLCAAGLVFLPRVLGQELLGVPLAYNALAILAALVGAVATIGRVPSIAVLMLLCGAAYSAAPINLTGHQPGPNIWLLAPAAACYVALRLPSPVGGRLAVALRILLVWCALCGVLGAFLRYFVTGLPRPWGWAYSQAWELCLPVAAIALAVVAIRAAQPSDPSYAREISRSVVFLLLPAAFLVFAILSSFSATALAGVTVLSMVAASGGMAWSRLRLFKRSES